MSFQDILNQKPSTIERPKPVPVGTYLSVLKGQPKFDKSTKKLTNYVEFTHELIQAQGDVDQTALAESGGIAGKTMRNTFYLTEDAKWRLKAFLVDHLGLDPGSGPTEKSMGELISEAPGKQVYVSVTHQASADGQAVFANINSTAKV